MMILNDKQIRELCQGTEAMINPFRDYEQTMPAPFYAVQQQLNGFGYDLLLGNNFKIPVPNYIKDSVIDPMSVRNELFRDFIASNFCIIPPNSFILGCSVEWINMPDDVIALCVGRSSYARCGVIVNVTPLEPGWSGIVTIEITNSNQLPVKVYPYRGICQVMFFKGEKPERTYRDKQGKYQKQVGVVPARGL